MEPQNPSNDVADPAEDYRTDLPSNESEQGQVQQPDHNDQVSNTPVAQDGQSEDDEQPREVNTVNQVNTVNEVQQEQPNQNPDSSESYPQSDNS